MLNVKRMLHWLVMSCFTASLIVGCGLSSSNEPGANPVVHDSSQSLTADCRMIEHDAGTTEVCGQPQTIAVLNVYTLDLLLSLNMQPAGYANLLSTYQGEVFDNPSQQIPYLGDRITSQPVNLGSAGQPSLETLTLLKPDLIIGEIGSDDNYDLLSQIAPTLLWQDRIAKDKWKESLQSLAVALGVGERAAEVMQQYEIRIANARADLANVVAAHPKLLLLAAHRLEEGISIIHAESYLGELLSKVGFQLVPQTTTANTPNAPISIEALPTLNEADTIIILGWNFDVSDEQSETPAPPPTNMAIGDWLEAHQVESVRQDWETNAIAQSLTASQENQVYFATFYKWSGINGPISAELILEQLRQFFLTDSSNP